MPRSIGSDPLTTNVCVEARFFDLDQLASWGGRRLDPADDLWLPGRDGFGDFRPRRGHPGVLHRELGARMGVRGPAIVRA